MSFSLDPSESSWLLDLDTSGLKRFGRNRVDVVESDLLEGELFLMADDNFDEADLLEEDDIKMCVGSRIEDFISPLLDGL